MLHVKVLPAVITSLEWEASERDDALALGLCKVVKEYNFIASLYTMCDVLPVSHPSCIFQSSTIDLGMMDSQVKSTIPTFELPKEENGMFAKRLHTQLLAVYLNSYAACKSMLMICPDTLNRMEEASKPCIHHANSRSTSHEYIGWLAESKA